VLCLFGFVKNAVQINYTENFGEWHMIQQAIKLCEVKSFFLHKKDFQSVANGDRRRVEIGLP